MSDQDDAGNERAERFLRQAREKAENVPSVQRSEPEIVDTPPGLEPQIEALQMEGGATGLFASRAERAIVQKNNELRSMAMGARAQYLQEVLDSQLRQAQAFLSGRAEIVAQEINQYVSSRVQRVYAQVADDAQKNMEGIVLLTNERIKQFAESDILDDLKTMYIDNAYKQLKRAVERIMAEDKTESE